MHDKDNGTLEVVAEGLSRGGDGDEPWILFRKFTTWRGIFPLVITLQTRGTEMSAGVDAEILLNPPPPSSEIYEMSLHSRSRHMRGVRRMPPFSSEQQRMQTQLVSARKEFVGL